MVDAKARSEAPKWRYRAFLSYSRVDDRVARWLHKSLENYILPKGLAERSSYLSKTKNWFVPIFRDRTDLSSGGDLVEKLREALDQSQYLILLCSPASAQSEIVNAEVEHFVANGRLDSVFPVIVSGEPYSGDLDTECIPPTLRENNIIAADMRNVKLNNGKQIGDGKDGAKFKLISGMLGVSLDKLLQRERRKANRRAAFQTGLSFVFLALALVAGSAAWMAYLSEQEAQRQRATAEASSEFLIDMFDSGVPRQQNPDTVTARTILDRGARRMNEQFADQPELKATLTSNIARAFSDLCATSAGIELVESSDVMTSEGGEGAVRSLILLSRMYIQDGRLEDATESIKRAFTLLAAFDRPNYVLEGYAWESRAMIDEDLYDFEAALEKFQIAIDTYEKVSPEEPRLLAAPLSNRANSLGIMGNAEQAEQDLLKARKLIEESDIPSRLRIARINWLLASNAYYANELDLAGSYLENASETFTELLEPGHPAMGDVLQLQGEIEYALGQQAAAIRSFNGALEIFENSDVCGSGFGVSTGEVYFRLAEIDIADGNFEQALENAARAENAMRATSEPLELNLAALETVRAEALFNLGEKEKAKKTCGSALAVIADFVGEDSPDYTDYAALCAAFE